MEIKTTILILLLGAITVSTLARSANLEKRQTKAGSYSEVHITVGEDPYFLYHVDGSTVGPDRISISGDYFNDAANGYGHTDLFLAAEPRIANYRWEIDYDRNELWYYILNSRGWEFQYRIRVPNGVLVDRDLRGYDHNLTAILVRGPSRNSRYWGL